MVFPVVIYGCESWTVKKAERWRIDAFELWCWRRLLRVPWTGRRSNQSILKEISPEYSWKDWYRSWSWSSNTLANWCEELTHLKRPWCWERLKTGGDEDDRGWDGWMPSLTRWTWIWVSSRELVIGKPGVLQPMGSQRVGHDWETELSQIHIYCIVLNLIHMNDLRTYPLNVKSWLTGKDPDAGKDWRQKEKRAADDKLDSITNSMDMNFSKLWEIVKSREAWHTAVQRVRYDWATEQQYILRISPGPC